MALSFCVSTTYGHKNCFFGDKDSFFGAYSKKKLLTFRAKKTFYGHFKKGLWAFSGLAENIQ